MFIAESLKAYVAQKSGLAQDAFSMFASERPAFGDFSTNAAFVLAQERNTSPFLVAEDLKRELEEDGQVQSMVERLEVKNGYINFFLSPEFAAQALRQVTKPEKRTARETVLVEYSSPNIGKTLSIAHIRSTIIGDALARIYKFLGYRVITDSHIGDWGMLAGKLIAAYKLFARKPVAKLTIRDMQDLYVRFTMDEKEKPEYTQMAKKETVKLQREEKDSIRMWQALARNSIKEFDRLYRRLGILKFTYQHGESHYRRYTEAVVPDCVKKGYARQSEGAMIIDLDKAGLPPMLIQKSDEGFLYATSDLATIIEREETIKPNRVLYVVANEQALHFEQLFAAARTCGLAQGIDLVHVKFGMILGQDKKKLSTRQGRTVLLEEVLDEAIKKAESIAQQKNPELSAQEIQTIARLIGIASVKYNDLSQNRNTDIVFDWSKMLSLDGNSAPYALYTYARLANIARKAHAKARALGVRDLSRLERQEFELAKRAAAFKDTVRQAAQENLPNLIANYLYDLAARSNAWYEQYPVLSAPAEARRARLGLAQSVCAVLKTGLGLLGIPVLEKI